MSASPSHLAAPVAVADHRRLFSRRSWLYPVVSWGRFWRGRLVLAILLTALYLGLPHLRIAGRPALQIDLAARQLHLIGATFFATETLLLAPLGIGLVVFIALFTALFGRVWCGWACPQPIYLEFIFRPLEALFEGPALRRRRRARLPLNPARLLRMAGKLGAFVVVAALFAHTFLAYFVGTERLWLMVRQSPQQSWAAFVTVLVVTGLVLLDFAYFREQTCIIACPYGRLQSLLVDSRSWIVGYDPGRGEPRRRLAERARSPAAAGDCIDCGACVRTCPTGIDIRNGLQLECIGCTQCIDACDQIMDRRGWARGLIRYTSLDELRGVRTTLFRPRLFAYAGVVVAAIAGLWVLLAQRSPVEFDLVRIAGSPFYVQADGKVCNRVRVRLTNRTASTQQVQVSLLHPDPGELIVREQPVVMRPLQVRSIEGVIRVPPSVLSAGRATGTIEVTAADGQRGQKQFVVLGPTEGA